MGRRIPLSLLLLSAILFVDVHGNPVKPATPVGQQQRQTHFKASASKRPALQINQSGTRMTVQSSNINGVNAGLSPGGKPVYHFSASQKLKKNVAPPEGAGYTASFKSKISISKPLTISKGVPVVPQQQVNSRQHSTNNQRGKNIGGQHSLYTNTSQKGETFYRFQSFQNERNVKISASARPRPIEIWNWNSIPGRNLTPEQNKRISDKLKSMKIPDQRTRESNLRNYFLGNKNSTKSRLPPSDVEIKTHVGTKSSVKNKNNAETEFEPVEKEGAKGVVSPPISQSESQNTNPKPEKTYSATDRKSLTFSAKNIRFPKSDIIKGKSGYRDPGQERWHLLNTANAIGDKENGGHGLFNISDTKALEYKKKAVSKNGDLSPIDESKKKFRNLYTVKASEFGIDKTETKTKIGTDQSHKSPDKQKHPNVKLQKPMNRSDVQASKSQKVNINKEIPQPVSQKLTANRKENPTAKTFKPTNTQAKSKVLSNSTSPISDRKKKMLRDQIIAATNKIKALKLSIMKSKQDGNMKTDTSKIKKQLKATLTKVKSLQSRLKRKKSTVVTNKKAFLKTNKKSSKPISNKREKPLSIKSKISETKDTNKLVKESKTSGKGITNTDVNRKEEPKVSVKNGRKQLQEKFKSKKNQKPIVKTSKTDIGKSDKDGKLITNGDKDRSVHKINKSKHVNKFSYKIKPSNVLTRPDAVEKYNTKSKQSPRNYISTKLTSRKITKTSKARGTSTNRKVTARKNLVVGRNRKDNKPTDNDNEAYTEILKSNTKNKKLKSQSSNTNGYRSVVASVLKNKPNNNKQKTINTNSNNDKNGVSTNMYDSVRKTLTLVGKSGYGNRINGNTLTNKVQGKTNDPKTMYDNNLSSRISALRGGRGRNGVPNASMSRNMSPSSKTANRGRNSVPNASMSRNMNPSSETANRGRNGVPNASTLRNMSPSSETANRGQREMKTSDGTQQMGVYRQTNIGRANGNARVSSVMRDDFVNNNMVNQGRLASRPAGSNRNVQSNNARVGQAAISGSKNTQNLFRSNADQRLRKNILSLRKPSKGNDLAKPMQGTYISQNNNQMRSSKQAAGQNQIGTATAASRSQGTKVSQQNQWASTVSNAKQGHPVKTSSQSNPAPLTKNLSHRQTGQSIASNRLKQQVQSSMPSVNQSPQNGQISQRGSGLNGQNSPQRGQKSQQGSGLNGQNSPQHLSSTKNQKITASSMQGAKASQGARTSPKTGSTNKARQPQTKTAASSGNSLQTRRNGYWYIDRNGFYRWYEVKPSKGTKEKPTFDGYGYYAPTTQATSNFASSAGMDYTYFDFTVPRTERKKEEEEES